MHQNMMQAKQNRVEFERSKVSFIESWKVKGHENDHSTSEWRWETTIRMDAVNYHL